MTRQRQVVVFPEDRHGFGEPDQPVDSGEAFQRYQDIYQNTIEGMKRLPLRAQVALAGRIARLAQALLQAAWPSAPDDILESVERAISVTERIAANTAHQEDLEVIENNANRAGAIGTEAREAFLHAAYSAASAVKIAAYAIAATENWSCVRKEQVERPGGSFWGVDAHAHIAAGRADVAMNQAISRDLEKLLQAATRDGWTDLTPVQPAFFDPPWPDGLPPGAGLPKQDKPSRRRSSAGGLPERRDLNTLPGLALVALAARTARLVEARFLTWPAPEDYVDDVRRTIQFAEAIASGESREDFSIYGSEKASTAALHAGFSSASAAARTAKYAADIALLASEAFEGTPDVPPETTLHPSERRSIVTYVDFTFRSAQSAAGEASVDLTEAIWRDCRKLHQAALEEKWQDTTPVRPAFFGELWPQGIPKGWPPLLASPEPGNMAPVIPDRDSILGPPYSHKEARKSSPVVEAVREKLRRAVEDSNLTYEEIGLRMGFGKASARAAISRILSPKSDHDPRLSTLLALANALGRSLNELV